MFFKEANNILKQLFKHVVAGEKFKPLNKICIKSRDGSF